jgi:hypothetical protein
MDVLEFLPISSWANIVHGGKKAGDCVDKTVRIWLFSDLNAVPYGYERKVLRCG